MHGGVKAFELLCIWRQVHACLLDLCAASTIFKKAFANRAKAEEGIGHKQVNTPLVLVHVLCNTFHLRVRKFTVRGRDTAESRTSLEAGSRGSRESDVSVFISAGFACNDA